MERKHPLLSICVPTMNRVELLELGLKNILSEAEPFGAEVEVVVTDNASVEDVKGLVQRISPSIKFGRLEQAQVFPRSIMFGPREIATGDYVWLMGNDDMIIRGAVGRILNLVRAHPELDYVYLNHGWTPVKSRNQMILEKDSRLPDGYQAFQCADKTTRVLPRFEDLVFLEEGTNPYAMFSTIFCYVAKRSLYTDFNHLIQPLDEWDDRVQTLDNMFPHTKLTMTAYAGKPVGYIGEACFMQGAYHQEWKSWILKTMIHGHFLMFDFLEKETAFGRDALEVLWKGLAQMSGRILVRMLDDPEVHRGLEILRAQALPRLSKEEAFWAAFAEEHKQWNETDYEARWLARTALKAMEKHHIQKPRIGLWGILGRGHRCITLNPKFAEKLCLLVDRSPELHGQLLDYTQLIVENPEAIKSAKLDLLVLGVRRDLANTVQKEAARLLHKGVLILSLEGLFRVGKGGTLEKLNA
jgi:hypothetical protein